MKNKAANAPITFEEIVMVMISALVHCFRHSVGKTKLMVNSAIVAEK